MADRAFDIVIVGSGAGGGVVAKELSSLCREGVTIAVLEAGPRLAPDEYTGRELEMVERLYIEGGGVFTRDRKMTIAAGEGYGGSTIVYTGTSFVAPREAIEGWGVEGLAYEDVERRSRKYMAENNVHELPPALINDNNRLFRGACEELGYRVGQFPVNVKGCQGAGLCNLGCPNGAKMGTDQVQLPEAEQNGVTVVTNCRVERIGDRVCHATVSRRDHGQPSVWEPGDYEIRAKMVVVCAGAIHTPALLLHSRLPTRLPELGRYFTCHPAMVLVGQHDRSLSNFTGHPKAYYCDEFAESGRFLLETCMYFPFMTAKSISGFGVDHAAMLERMDRLQMILVLASDPSLRRNRITVDRRGAPVVDYRLGQDVLESLVEAMRVSTRIFFASGARRVHAPAAPEVAIEASEQDRIDELITMDGMKAGRVSVTSAHPMGGCRMGSDPETSVTDAWGQVHGLPWLFVADASLFPACSKLNPYITVMALADRVAERVRSRVQATP